MRGSVVVTAYDSESARPGSNPEWGQYTMKLRSLHKAYPSLHPSGVVHWVREQLNIKAVTGHASWLMVAALCCVRPQVQWPVSSGICHRNKVNSTAWLYHDGPFHKIVSFTFEKELYGRKASGLLSEIWQINAITTGLIFPVIIIIIIIWFGDTGSNPTIYTTKSSVCCAVLSWTH